MTSSPNSIAATKLQSWLTVNWDRACQRLDDPAPLTASFHASMDKWHQAANRFEAVEASWRRGNKHFCPEWDEMEVSPGDPEMDACLCFKGCIGTPEKCATSVVSCRHCVETAKERSDGN